MVNTGSDKEQVPYIQVDAAPADYVYSKGKFYYQTAGYNTSDVEDDIYAIANDDYDGSIKYYTFEDDAIENFDTRFDLLVRKVNTAVDTFDINGPMMQASIYHTYNSNRNYFVKDENNEYVAWIHSDISEP
jgi:hypothetical protein